MKPKAISVTISHSMIQIMILRRFQNMATRWASAASAASCSIVMLHLLGAERYGAVGVERDA
jgi:hypothetical protein